MSSNNSTNHICSTHAIPKISIMPKRNTHSRCECDQNIIKHDQWLSLEKVHTQFVKLAHTPTVDRDHHPEFDLDADHSPFLQHMHSFGVDSIDTLPAAK